MNKLLFIINPKAGNGDITKAIEDIELIAKEKNVEYDTYYT
ncbi:MAG: diacylglycerol kinase family lipid kinase, partial [Bacteroidales bacterium]|nr:diacylglycerol kinase family lipid kinase [Bacteroidales bacterium]